MRGGNLNRPLIHRFHKGMPAVDNSSLRGTTGPNPTRPAFKMP